MSIGYACLNIGTPNTNIRSVMQRNATPEKLTEVTAHNLEALEKMVDYNSANDIRLYRISSDLIPFCSTPAAMPSSSLRTGMMMEKNGEGGVMQALQTRSSAGRGWPGASRGCRAERFPHGASAASRAVRRRGGCP